MSSIYVSEPPTKGKVIVQTTYGPLDIELWPKEAPKAVRNFVQLCLEGYYNNTIFHRIIKSFLVQAGDPTGTGSGGESIYGGAFSDEFHSRLRFNHRGLVACANAGSPHSNGSQFFISLDRCEWLDRKNTIFGKVTGDSIYNLLALGEVETGKDDRPLDSPPKVISVEVLWNPFDDIIPREISATLRPLDNDTETKDTQKKGVKKLNLLSFGEEAEEEEEDFATIKQKIKSSHDVLDDPRLLKEDALNQKLEPSEIERTRGLQLSVREALTSKKDVKIDEGEAKASDSRNYSDNGDDDDNEANFDARMRQKILKKREELGDLLTKRSMQNGLHNSALKDRDKSARRPKAEDSDERRKVDKLSVKKRGIGSEARAERMVNADIDLQLLGKGERERHLQKQKKRRLRGHEDDVLAKLESFKKSMAAKHVQEDTVDSQDEKGDDLSDWKSVRLKFAPEPGKDRMSRNEEPNDYVVQDPLLEQGKEKFNRIQAKQKRREREWAGKSLT